MGDYGAKVSKEGYSVLTAAPKDLVFSSKYQTLRVHARGSGSITHTGGRTVTIAHGLGYVPVFIIHSDLGASGSYFQLPFTQSYGISAPQYNEDILTWADATNIYIKVESDFGYKTFNINDVAEEDGLGYARSYFGFGHNFDIFGDMNGAMRFGSVSVARNATIYEASVGFYVATRWGSDNMYVYLYGIDEDNTADFSSNPFGRPTTTAVHRPEGNWSASNTHYVGCKEAVQEIVNRGSWNSGNNLGLMFRDEGPSGESPDGNGVFDGSSHYLRILDTNNLLNYKYTIFKDKIE